MFPCRVCEAQARETVLSIPLRERAAVLRLAQHSFPSFGFPVNRPAVRFASASVRRDSHYLLFPIRSSARLTACKCLSIARLYWICWADTSASMAAVYS